MVAETSIPATEVPDNVRVHPLARMTSVATSPDAAYSDAFNRNRGDEPPPKWLIDGLLPIGVMVLVADPGAGKSMITQQILHHLCYGRPLGDWDSPGLGGHLAWVVDLEGDAGLNRDRGYAITPWQTLPGDQLGPAREDHHLYYSHTVIPDDEREAWLTIRGQAERHIRYVATVLDESADAGAPIDVVVIDTLGKFLGGKGKHDNAYDWEAKYVGQLNTIARDRGVAIILIHHTNKAGEISGSTGIGGSSTVACKLETVHDDETGLTTGTLRSFKVRSAAPFAFPVEQNDDGTWTFTDLLHPSEAMAAGLPRKVLAGLAGGPRSRAELRPLGLGSSLGKVLDRLRKQGKITYRFGRWELVDDGRRTRPGNTGTCEVCREPMTKLVDDQRTHPLCDPEPAPAAAAPEPDDQADDYDEPADELVRVNGFKLMKEALEASRMHPVPRIRETDRIAPPWALPIDAAPARDGLLDWERMTGEHRWSRGQLPLAGRVAVLDRSGSYPSAAGSVPVAANLLTHTGPLDERGHLAGVFLIGPVSWTDERIGHPLGRLGEHDGPVWVTTPHLDLLMKLSDKGTVTRPVILDSWAGKGTSGLFTAYSKRVQEARRKASGTDAYPEVKRRSSIALRSLWPKGARSPFWRPDWSVSIRAEASVRHWVRAWQAVEAGAELVAIGMVDEVAFIAPDDAGDTWVPEPYTLGSDYGQVKHKDVKVGDERVPSPITIDQWASTRQGRRAR
jgi:hypothetical protein